MLRACSLLIAPLFVATSALAATEVETCRDNQADAAIRLTACNAVIADDKAAGRPKAFAHWYVADSLLKKRDYDGAVALLNKGLELDPDSALVLNARGLAYSNRGEEEKALADYDAALQKRPNFPSPHNNRGLIYMRRGELQRAYDEIMIALSLNSGTNRALNLYNLGRVQALRKQYDSALAYFAEAKQLTPEAWQIPNYRCTVYADMGRLDEALADCNEVLAQHPKWAGPLAWRGNVYRLKGNLGAALKDYNDAIKFSPNFVRAYVGRAQVHEARKDMAAARADYRSAGAALTKVDDYETTQARAFARERLAALIAADPSLRNQAAGPVTAPGGKAAPPAAATTRKVALIVGNGAYKSVPRLDNPPRDAKLIADTLRGLGFQTVTLASDLDRDRFFAALRDFGREAERSDWAVVYFAGHGMEIGGVNYLIPVDAKLAADRDAENQAVALEQVIAAVSGARKLRLVMLDACRDNPFEQTMQHTIAMKLVGKGLSNIEPEAGFMVVYAAKHGETALDGDALNSPFATAVAREIKVPKVEVRRLFDIVRDDVWNATNRRQQPFSYGSLPGREDFYFVAGN
ncbi:caspase family protein [Bradyrhizobium lablabi]|uniref:caspase family protein n=1 Tax=Bradyrhizobium lablabi TaxID=722472 RepID=UPI001BAA508E|nr:caspase family protein [Bradyrhizobium lablabi]MBR1125873.1 caspase family protein [Bradyrhizobium lablabi]